MACYSAQDNENWQKRSEKQLTKIMKNMINIAFCRSIDRFHCHATKI